MFATLPMNGTIYRERHLLTVGGKDIKNPQEILNLTQAVWLPSQVAAMHCPGQ